MECFTFLIYFYILIETDKIVGRKFTQLRLFYDTYFLTHQFLVVATFLKRVALGMANS